MPVSLSKVVEMADSQIVTNQKWFKSCVLVLRPGIVLETKWYSHKVLDSTHWSIVVGLVEIVETYLTVCWGCNKTLWLSHEVNASDPTWRYLDGLLPLKLETKPNFNCAISWRCDKSDVLLWSIRAGNGLVLCATTSSASILLVLILLNDYNACNHVIMALSVCLWRRIWLIGFHVLKMLLLHGW